MPRTLPWLKEEAIIKREQLTPTPTSRRAVKSEPPKEPKSESDVTPKAEGTPKSRGPKKRDFFPPTPPSSPIHRCPSEEYLREGFDKDDIYMMVEDEFYAVAQTFTQHLHYAEYVRRKKEAKLQSATVIQNLARPTDGVTPMSEEVKRRKAAEELSLKQKAGVERGRGERPAVDSEEERDDNNIEEEGEEGDMWAGTSLHDLMVSPRKARSLVGIQGVKSSTRAAAGLRASLATGTGRWGSGDDGIRGAGAKDEEEVDLLETDSGDDDLDARTETKTPTPMRPVKQGQQGQQQQQQQQRRSTDSDSKVRGISSLRSSPVAGRATEDRGIRRVKSMSARTSTPTGTQSKRRLLFDDFDELPELHKSNIQVQGQRSSPSLGGDTQQTPRGIDPKAKKKSRLNEVPTFLF
ncbi:hypothetical protein BO70DRAFT_393553 [Aspergillus heteromorphus CBS 117.55]|uniref:Uncharacterized protein n=1 Tax=Aspergillus heteromorphus CBS 117.55 TaxID=1448321 RepID=A0A317WRG2_9EURO|nr:uncharacterized protein BO70DRAFT_393553 [Aspergillus heteromorphus CBS 117.55]PWY89036.1 hypothetical protein BO70DRAFT_393553 [Aspergillus heteromorphus CBS 117.55]